MHLRGDDVLSSVRLAVRFTWVAAGPCAIPEAATIRRSGTNGIAQAAGGTLPVVQKNEKAFSSSLNLRRSSSRHQSRPPRQPGPP